MARETFVLDRETDEIVSKEERVVRQAQRNRNRPIRPVAIRKVQRGRWVLDPATHELVDYDEYHSRPRTVAHQIMPDIAPYKNVAVDGKYITSRSEHREMLKRNRLFELGNEQKPLGERPQMSSVELTVKRICEQKGL